jgi:hypothetical protein
MRTTLIGCVVLLGFAVVCTLDLQADVAEARQVEVSTPRTDLIEVTGPDGVVHTGCVITVAEPSSTVTCADGFTEES